ERFVIPTGQGEAIAVDRFQKVDKPRTVLARLGKPTLEEFGPIRAGGRRGLFVRRAPRDRRVFPEVADSGKEIQPLFESLYLVFPLGILVVRLIFRDVSLTPVVGAIAVDHFFVSGLVQFLFAVVL